MKSIIWRWYVAVKCDSRYLENGCDCVSKVVPVPMHHITEKSNGMEEWSHLCILKLMLDVCEFSASYFVSFISHKRAVIT